MDSAEGTVKLGCVLQEPLARPLPERTTIIEGVTPAGTLARIDIDEAAWLHWIRQAPGGQPASASVDLSTLDGATKLDFWCAWSPYGLNVHVGDRDDPQRIVSSEASS